MYLTQRWNRSEFRFLDPGPLVDHELSLIVPATRHLDDVLESANHILSLSEPQAEPVTRQQFLDFLRAAPRGQIPGDDSNGRVPSYHYWMLVRRTEDPPLPPWGTAEPPVKIAGRISLRIGHTQEIERYFGHVGYNVYTPARGNHYAERSCRLLFPLARAHGLRDFWITCNPDNIPSRRTCERLGGELVEIVDVPFDNLLYQRGERQKCRYRIQL